MHNPTETNSRNLLTVRRFCDEHPDFTNGMVRWWLFHREENGLSRAVRKVGRRIFIDEEEFFEWFDTHCEG